MLVKVSGGGILMKPITPIEDLAGVDAGKVHLTEMRRKLDAMRQQDRY